MEGEGYGFCVNDCGLGWHRYRSHTRLQEQSASRSDILLMPMWARVCGGRIGDVGVRYVDLPASYLLTT